MKQNFSKPMLWWTLFAIAIGWLLLVWAPMVRRDNEIDPQKVLQDSQAKIDEARAKLHDLNMQTDAVTKDKSLDTLPPDGK